MSIKEGRFASKYCICAFKCAHIKCMHFNACACEDAQYIWLISYMTKVAADRSIEERRGESERKGDSEETANKGDGAEGN